MTVMYAYALYKNGFAKEGFEVLQSIYRMSMDTSKSKIYPGIPEYFDSEGRGMYPYLTGSASWLVLTQLTQVFGVRGRGGDLLLSPKLVKEEFNAKGVAAVSCQFAGTRLHIQYMNPSKLDYGRYAVQEVCLGTKPLPFEQVAFNIVRIKRELIARIPTDSTISVRLGKAH